MSYLPETSQALAELGASQVHGFGMHFGDRTAIGTAGMFVGEEPFDPARHSVEAINPTSDMEMATGWPQVAKVMPYRPLEVNVVLHQDPAEKFMDPWLQPVREHKRILARELYESLTESIQRADDTHVYTVGDQEANLYIVGDTSSANMVAAGAEIIEQTENPQAAAEAIGEICLRGLTFVVSDYFDLPLENAAGADFSQTVAIKTNHKFETEVPLINEKFNPFGQKLGKFGAMKLKPELELRGLGKVLLWDALSVKGTNTELKRVHEGLNAKLAGLGMSVSQVVTDQNLDIAAADYEIARAVRSIDA